MAKRVLVTGPCDCPGASLIRALEEHPLVERVVAVDPAASSVGRGGKVKLYKADVRDEFLLRSILEEEGIDTIFHLAHATTEPADEVRAREVHVSGTLTVLEAASKSSAVRRLIIAGSALAYGARRSNPARLCEDQPLRAAGLRFAVHKRLMEEELAQSLPQARKSLNVAVLRLCPVAGGAPFKDLLSGPRLFSVFLKKGAVQFIAESDLVNVLVRAMQAPDLRGAYNVAPDDFATLDELCRAANVTRIPVPHALLWLAKRLGRAFFPRSGIDERAVAWLAYPVVMSNEKIKKALGLKLEKGSLAAFLERSGKTSALTKEEIMV